MRTRTQHLLHAALAGAALLTLSACTTCPACHGAGMQVYTEYGLAPNSQVFSKNYRFTSTVTCGRCWGYGIAPGWMQQQQEPYDVKVERIR